MQKKYHAPSLRAPKVSAGREMGKAAEMVVDVAKLGIVAGASVGIAGIAATALKKP